MTDKKYYINQLEWEAIDFPLILTNLKIEDPEFALDENATLKLWRDHNQQLKATIAGRLKDFKYSDKYIGKGNIAQHQIIEGIDEKGNIVTLSRCVFGGYQSSNQGQNKDGYLSTIDLHFDRVRM